MAHLLDFSSEASDFVGATRDELLAFQEAMKARRPRGGRLVASRMLEAHDAVHAEPLRRRVTEIRRVSKLFTEENDKDIDALCNDIDALNLDSRTKAAIIESLDAAQVDALIAISDEHEANLDRAESAEVKYAIAKQAADDLWYRDDDGVPWIVGNPTSDLYDEWCEVVSGLEEELGIA